MSDSAAIDPANTIAFQGVPGAYSHLACVEAKPDMTPLACRTFPDAFKAVQDGKAALGMIPIDNSVAGRVADIHHLLPDSHLHIVGEHFHRVNHHLLVVPGATVTDLTHVHSHIHALNQCRDSIAEMGLEPVEHVDTAGAAADVAKWGDKSQAAIASSLAAEIHGLASLRASIEDAEHNTTRFVLMAKEPAELAPDERVADGIVTSFVFRVRNVPAALYKALGGFATNGVNMTKLESYVSGDFVVAQFYAEVDGHPDQRPVKLALEELDFFTHEVRILGTYRAHPFRGAVDAGG